MRRLAVLISCVAVFAACSSSSKSTAGSDTTTTTTAVSASTTTTTVATGRAAIGHVFVINLENENYADVWGAKSKAKYLNGTLRKQGIGVFTQPPTGDLAQSPILSGPFQ